MTMTLGGTSGVTYPDSTNTPASGVTAKFTPWITDTANVMTLRNKINVSGTSGVTVNGTLYTTA